MAEAHNSTVADNRIAYVRQTITALRHDISDRERWATQAARLCANHAPEDAAWVRAEIRRYAPGCTVALALLPDAPKPLDHVKPTTAGQDAAARLPWPASLPCAGGLHDPVSAVPVDAEANRIMIALRLGPQARVYWIAQELNRRAGGAGRIDEQTLVDALLAAGVEASVYTMRHNWIKDGDGLLWNRDGKGRLYLVSYKRERRDGRDLPALLTRLAIEAGKPELVATNRVGSKFIKTPIGGSLKRWYGNSLAAWHNSRADHTRRISRLTLQALWGVTRKTLASWERAAGITVVKCYANYTDDDAVPEHAYPTIAAVKSGDKTEYVMRPRARVSNVYNAPSMREVQHRMTPRKAFRRSTAALELASALADTPGSDCGATADNSGAGYCATGRRSFYADSGSTSDAFAHLHDHLRRDTLDKAPHYVALGWDTKAKCWLYEQNSTGFQQTTLTERVSPEVENFVFARTGGRARYAAAWRVN